MAPPRSRRRTRRGPVTRDPPAVIMTGHPHPTRTRRRRPIVKPSVNRVVEGHHRDGRVHPPVVRMHPPVRVPRAVVAGGRRRVPRVRVRAHMMRGRPGVAMIATVVGRRRTRIPRPLYRSALRSGTGRVCGVSAGRDRRRTTIRCGSGDRLPLHTAAGSAIGGAFRAGCGRVALCIPLRGRRRAHRLGRSRRRARVGFGRARRVRSPRRFGSARRFRSPRRLRRARGRRRRARGRRGRARGRCGRARGRGGRRLGRRGRLRGLLFRGRRFLRVVPLFSVFCRGGTGVRRRHRGAQRRTKEEERQPMGGAREQHHAIQGQRDSKHGRAVDAHPCQANAPNSPVIHVQKQTPPRRVPERGCLYRRRTAVPRTTRGDRRGRRAPGST